MKIFVWICCLEMRSGVGREGRRITHNFLDCRLDQFDIPIYHFVVVGVVAGRTREQVGLTNIVVWIWMKICDRTQSQSTEISGNRTEYILYMYYVYISVVNKWCVV